MIILETKNLRKHFDGVYAVDDLSIRIEKGEITSIIGPNGSGKTTLINALSGMLDIDGGLVVIEESEKLSKIKPHRVASFGLTRTFQNIRLFEQMTALDNILVVVTDRRVFKAVFETHQILHLKKAEEVLTRVGLWEKRDQLAVNLSYGQRKLLEIARALAMDAKIYLLDEPFAGLSPEMVKVISGIIRELKTQSKTVVLIEHDMGLIRELSDYVFVMDSGKLLAEGQPEEVLQKREVIEAYLGD